MVAKKSAPDTQGELQLVQEPWIGAEHMNIKNEWHPSEFCWCRDCFAQFPGTEARS